jgi:site-specific DNA-methyltransferase (adenine-specific)/modification methylase
MTDFEKIVIGDCTLYKGDSYELLAHGVFGEIGGICSDPPYGIGYQHSGNSNSVLKATTKIDSAPIGRDGRKRILLFGADHYKHRLPDYGTLLAWDKHLGLAGDDSFCDCEFEQEHFDNACQRIRDFHEGRLFP